MQQSYHHLSSEERAVIQVCRAQGQSLGAIARALGRSASTASRELSKMPAQYNATDAAKIHLQRRAHSRRKKKIRDGTPLFTKVRNMLECRQCSPEQIAHKLRLENPDDPSMYVSHESIYWAIYAHPRNALKIAVHQPVTPWPNPGEARDIAASLLPVFRWEKNNAFTPAQRRLKPDSPRGIGKGI